MSIVGNWRGAEILKDGLVLYFDPGSPSSFFYKDRTNVDDVSGNYYDCTLVNGVQYNTAVSGNFQLDGINDYISIPPHPSSTGLTLSFWIYIPSAGWTGLNSIIGDGFQNNNIGYIWIYRAYANGFSWQFATDTVRSAVDDSTIMTGSFDTWINLVFTADYSNPSAVVYSFYKNGVLSSTHTVGIGAKAPISLTRFIGSYDGNFFFDALRIGNYLEYNRALTSAEVLYNFNATKERFGYPWDPDAEFYFSRSQLKGYPVPEDLKPIYNDLFFKAFKNSSVGNIFSKVKSFHAFCGRTNPTATYIDLVSPDVEAYSNNFVVYNKTTGFDMGLIIPQPPGLDPNDVSELAWKLEPNPMTSFADVQFYGNQYGAGLLWNNGASYQAMFSTALAIWQQDLANINKPYIITRNNTDLARLWIDGTERLRYAGGNTSAGNQPFVKYIDYEPANSQFICHAGFSYLTPAQVVEVNSLVKTFINTLRVA